MKRFFLICLVLLISVVSCGCNNNLSILTEGSTSMEYLIGIMGEAYYEKSGVRVGFNPTGSTSGIIAVKQNRCDIGLSSRELKSSETGLDTTLIAYDAIVVIVNSSNHVANLSSEQLRKIFVGEITNWSDVGGNDHPIVVIGRELNSGTRDGFESVLNTVNQCKYTRELTSSGDIIQTVATNINAIGYISFATINDKVNVLSIDNVLPSVESVQNGFYKLRRNYYFVTRKGEELSPKLKDFIDFVLSEDTNELVIKSGAIPLKK